MAVAASTNPLRALCDGLTLMVCQFAVGGTGAVGALKRTGFGTTEVAGLQGTVVRDSTGQYTITLPGIGGFFMVAPFQPVVTGATDLRARVEAVDAAARTIQIQFLNASNAAADPGSGETVTLWVGVSDFPHI